MPFLALFTASLIGLLGDFGPRDRKSECAFSWQPYYTTHHQPSPPVGLGEQVWAIRQLRDGSIVAATTSGISVYDGTAWSLLTGTAEKPYFSLGATTNGDVYFGGYKDFGIIEQDSAGVLSARSLLKPHGVDPAGFSRVWSVVTTDDGIVFQTPERLYRYAHGVVRPVGAPGPIHNAFGVGNRTFVRVIGYGLFELREGRLSSTPGGDLFANKRIFLMTESSDGRLIIGTNESGFYTSSPADFEHVETALDTVGIGYRRYHGVAFQDGKLAIATLGAGLILLEQDGSLLANVTTRTYLKDDNINTVFIDNQNGLWIGYNSASISRIDVCSPIAKVDTDSGYKGGVRSVTEVGDRLFVATGSSQAGLLIIDRRSGSMKASGDVLPWAVKSCPGFIVVSTEDGLSLYEDQDPSEMLGRRLSTVIEPAKPRVVSARPGRPDCRFLVGAEGGIWEIRIAGGTLSRPELILVAEDVDDILELETGEVWYVERGVGVKRWMSGVDSSPEFVDGLPDSEAKLRLFTLGSSVAVLPHLSEDFYIFDQGAQKLLAAKSFRGTESHGWIHAITVTPRGEVWKVYENLVEVWKPYLNDGYRLHIPPSLRFPIRWASHIYVDSDDIAWFNPGHDLLRFDTRAAKDYGSKFQTVISIVTSGSRADTVASRISQSAAERINKTGSLLEIDYSENVVAFEFKAIFFNRPDLSEFRYRLVGLDSTWSSWSPVQSKRYSGLEPGRFRFEVEARNVHEQVGERAGVSFVVRTPWYRSVIWRLIMAVAAMGFVAALVHYRRLYISHRHAVRQAEELAHEKRLSQRLQEANDQLSRANRMKDEFLATTSHELRTPITAMISAAEILQSEIPLDVPYREFANMIDESGRRLMSTLSGILDIAQIRAGTLEMAPEDVNIGEVVEVVLGQYRDSAQSKGLYLNAFISPCPLAWIDRTAAERIVTQLMSNAVKFTEHGGVQVRVESEDGFVRLSVRDTGVGVDESYIPRLFDEFQQESHGEAREHIGTGLGLAIVSGLSKAVGASVHVNSKKGVGSVFEVIFPCKPPVKGLRTGMADREEDRPAVRPRTTPKTTSERLQQRPLD